jgi:hypothetical protein
MRFLALPFPDLQILTEYLQRCVRNMVLDSVRIGFGRLGRNPHGEKQIDHDSMTQPQLFRQRLSDRRQECFGFVAARGGLRYVASATIYSTD